MTLVVVGIDALDPDLVDPTEHFALTLEAYKSIETILSAAGEPSTHELWPTIITGLSPEKHGITIDDGIAWGNPVLESISSVADFVLPHNLQVTLGAWILNNTGEDAFRLPATYYEKNNISTVFDGFESAAIGIPNYVVELDDKDQEHQLRQRMGELFDHTPEDGGRHQSTDPATFYELCMEMSMIRIARIRRALRSRNYELIFGYTSGLDLIGHIAHSDPTLQQKAYEELNDFLEELVSDLRDEDELLLVSDHGLQNGMHTEEAMVAATDERIVNDISDVTDIYGAICEELSNYTHKPAREQSTQSLVQDSDVRDQLEDLGYL